MTINLTRKWIMAIPILLPFLAILLFPIASYGADLSFGGHYEVKAFAYDNADMDDGVDDEVSFVEHELRLNMDFMKGPVKGRLQINSGTYTWGDEQDIEDDEWHREMYISFPLGRARVKVGRMETEDPFKGLLYAGVSDGLKVAYPISPSLSADISIRDLDEEDGRRDILYSFLIRYSPPDQPVRGALGWYMRATEDSTTEDRPQWLAATVDTHREGLTFKVTGA